MKDTGSGIKVEDQSKLFKLLGKLESQNELNYKMGIGLGLYICKLIVEACGGTIHYDSAYTEGSAFVFTIRASTVQE